MGPSGRVTSVVNDMKPYDAEELNHTMFWNAEPSGRPSLEGAMIVQLSKRKLECGRRVPCPLSLVPVLLSL
jgi:hypothetical protein